MAPILEIRDLTKHFGGIAALADCTFSLERPGIYGVIGPNGAGKTTLFDAITGLTWPDQGTIAFEGRPIGGLRPFQVVARGIARSFQECRVFPEMTCLENLLFAVQGKDLGSALLQAFGRLQGGAPAGLEEAERLLERVGLAAYRDEPASVLSNGQRRLLEIVSALMTHPRLLLLDEPTSGVNPALIGVLEEFIRSMHAETGAAFLIIEHNMEFIMRASDHLIVMHQGAVLEEGPPRSIQASQAVVDAYLG
jgi:ABC-type branched-subunit amino acid transport system ATPase component